MNKDKNIPFFNAWANWYDAKIIQFWMKRFQVPVFGEIDFSAKGKILDVGCGTGEFLKDVKARDSTGKTTLTGIDLSEKMIERAEKKLPTAALIRGDVHQLPFKDDFFDYVVSTEAFHHYRDQKKALREMTRVCKGKVIIVDINFFLQPIHWLFEKLEPGCVKVNNRKEMKRLFEEAELKNIRQKRTFLFAVMTLGVKNDRSSPPG